MNQIKAVIFDADGPLYQRTSKNNDANIQLLSEFGFAGDYSQFVTAYNKDIHKVYDRSMTVETLFSNIFEQLDIKSDYTSRKLFIDRFYEIRAQISPSPHAVETLKWVHDNGFKSCVLTDHYLSASGIREWLDKLGEAQYLDEIVSSFDTRRLKGSPQAFQECLSRLGVTKQEAVFVGHQQYEMDGANKAGITSICLRSIAIPSDAKGNHSIDSLSDLPGLLEELNGN